MPVNLSQYRGTVGLFNSEFIPIKQSNIFYCAFFRNLDILAMISVLLSFFIYVYVMPSVINGLSRTLLLRGNSKSINSFVSKGLYVYMLVMFMRYIWVYSITIKMSGDIEMNPGPKPSSCNKFSICHWNLNSISAHNFIKLSLLRAYISVHNFDILCLSETYLDSTISSNDSNLIIPNYELYRADHPSNVKRGGICIYYKNLLPLKVTNIQYLQEYINFEMKIGDKLCNFVALYRSPSQSQDEFEKFAKNLELNLDTISANNPFLTVALGDFNAKSNLWYKNDKTTIEGSKIDGIASQFGLHQLINEPTQSKLNSLIEESKHKYHARLSKKLSDPATSPKSYWSILKTFLNNKKIPCIPPLLHENKFIIDFRKKAEIFNTFFCETMFSYKYQQCSSDNFNHENS